MEVKKVLWPTDFSSSAEAALPYVISLVQQYGAEIHVLHVMEDLAHHEGWYGTFEEANIEKLMRQFQQRAKERLDQICDRHLGGCLNFIKHVAVGDPAKEILKFIETEKVDTVVMATKGEGPDPFFGSTTERVVKHSPVPVTTIPVAGASGK